MRKPFQKDFPEVTQLEACEGHCFGLNTTELEKHFIIRKKESLKKEHMAVYVFYNLTGETYNILRDE